MVSLISIAFVVAKLYIFKVFRTDSASMKWPILVGFWAITPPQILLDFAEIFTRGSSQEDTNSVWRILEKFKFLQKQEIPKIYTFGLHVWSSFDPFSPLKMTEIKKTKYFQDKIQPSGCPNIAKSKPYLLSILQEKYDYFLLYFGYFLPKKGSGHKLKDRNQNMTYPILPTRFLKMLLLFRI